MVCCTSLASLLRVRLCFRARCRLRPRPAVRELRRSREMKIESQLELPEKACAYERYDLKTLEPLNGETYIRLQELGWSAQDFTGRTVLDIGCNSGLLTMYALRLGAAKVDACDVQPAFVEFVSGVVQAQGLPVTVSGINFNNLCPAERKADI